MHRLGIGLMAFGALATMVLIGLDAQGSSMFAALVLGAGALTAFFAGCMIFSQTSAKRAETRAKRLNELIGVSMEGRRLPQYDWRKKP